MNQNDLLVIEETDSSKEKESGQALIEYALLLAMAMIVALPMSRQIVSFMDQSVARLGSTLEKKLYTGKAHVTVWGN